VKKKRLSVLKRERQNLKRRLRNKSGKSKIKTYFKKVMSLINDNKIDEAKKYANTYYSIVDKAVKTGVIHRNTGARKKSLLAKYFNKKIANA